MPGTETVKEKKDTRRRGKGRKSKSSSSSKKAAHQQEEEHFEEEFQQEQEQLDQPITNEDVKDEQEQVEQGNENKIDNMFVESTSATVDAKVNEDPFSIPVADYGRLDLDVIQYFQGVEKMLDDEEKFETVEGKLELELFFSHFQMHSHLTNHNLPNSDRALFVSNVYREVELKELKVATDPESSRVLEKLLRASNDFQLRIFADRLRGSYASLFTHRFASHVCQTLLVLAADVMERELRGKSKLEGMDEATLESLKELPTMQQIFLDICEVWLNVLFPVPFIISQLRNLTMNSITTFSNSKTTLSPSCPTNSDPISSVSFSTSSLEKRSSAKAKTDRKRAKNTMDAKTMSGN